MKVGERGQVTIPKEIRDRFAIEANSDVEFSVDRGQIVLRKVTAPLPLEKWKGYCGTRFRELGIKSVDEFMDEVRGR